MFTLGQKYDKSADSLQTRRHFHHALTRAHFLPGLHTRQHYVAEAM